MKVAVVGGGISGLSVAHYLVEAGIEAALIEPTARLGGVIHTEHIQGCAVEGGPDGFLASKPWAFNLIRELGLADQVIGSNDHRRKTWVWRDGRLVRFPEGMQLIAPTRIAPILSSRLISTSTKLRMALEYFRKPVIREDRSVAAFVRDHYGGEAVDYIAEPLLAGVYGGDPEEMSADSVLPRFVGFERKYGSVTRGVMAEPAAAKGPLFQTMKNGMAQLIEALHPKCEVIRGAVETVEPGYRLRIAGNWMEADAAILACGARAAAALLAPSPVSEMLRAIPYRSAHIVALGFRRNELKHPLDGFGFLVPKREGRRMRACTWVGTKFPHRVPDGYALLRCFFASEASEADALAELETILGVRAKPVFSRVFNWPDSMPQYTVGHERRIAEIEAGLPESVYLAGNAYHGIGIPDCIREAKAAADKIRDGASAPRAIQAP